MNEQESTAIVEGREGRSARARARSPGCGEASKGRLLGETPRDGRGGRGGGQGAGGWGLRGRW